MITGWGRRRDRIEPASSADATSVPLTATDTDSDLRSPYETYVPVWTAYLDLARWLLDQQQRRDSTFRQTAVGLIGFDGLLLTVLLSSGAFANLDRFSAAWWAMCTGSVLLALSSIFGVVALIPRKTNAVDAEAAIKAWEKYTEDEKNGDAQKSEGNRPAQHAAEMLLKADQSQDPSGRDVGVAKRWHTMRRPDLPAQPLLAAQKLATTRGRLATVSASLLAVGIACLAIVLITSPTARDESRPSPTIIYAPPAEEGK